MEYKKKKILITLGCSMTEGYGCYIDKYIIGNKLVNFPLHEINFHTKGWPNRVGKKMGYDWVINISKAGSGNNWAYSGFMDWLNPNDFKEYEVDVIWLIAEPMRRDIYWDTEMKTVSFDPTDDTDWQTLYSKAIFLSENFEIDSLLSTRILLRAFKEICKNRGWHSIILSYGNFHKNSTNSINLKNEIDVITSDLIATEHIHPYCGHPNETGYEIISERIIDILKKNKWSENSYNENINVAKFLLRISLTNTRK